ncbi:type II secretion system F family protein [Mycoplasmatota bacterium]|nr:type II secretion system F family protein [Mycoplasmatota bacterium]
MPFYRYKAKNRDHYVVSDILEAVDKGDCVRRIKKNDMVPLEVVEIKLTSFMKGKEVTITSGVSKQDLVFFLSQLYNLLNSGLGIIDCLKIIIEQSENKYLKKYLIKVLQDIRNGSSLYRSMSRQRKVFPKLLIEMIRVGEVIGNLKEVVYDLHLYYKKQTRTSSEIKAALMYPIFLLVATFAVTTFLMIAVIPQFQDTFSEMGKELPSVTRFVLAFSHFLQTKFIFVLLIFALISTLAVLYNRSTDGKMFYSKLALKIPIFGQISRKGNLIKIARTYSTLLNNSVNAIEALEITKNILSNQIYIEIIDRALLNIQNGVPLSKAFEKQWAVDPVFASMMAIGEETATLDEMLASIAEYYDNEMDMVVEKLKKMMEPLMIMILATVVGTIVLSIMLPMFGMMDGGLG